MKHKVTTFELCDRVTYVNPVATKNRPYAYPGITGTIANSRPDWRGLWLVQWDGGAMRWCTGLKTVRGGRA